MGPTLYWIHGVIDLNLKYNITYRQTMNIYSFICSSVKYDMVQGKNDLMSGTGHLRDFHDTSRVFADIPIPTLKKSLL